jgi:hypothetical protein
MGFYQEQVLPRVQDKVMARKRPGKYVLVSVKGSAALSSRLVSAPR